MSRARHISALAVALAALAIPAGCGGGGAEGTSSTTARQGELAQAQAAADAEVRAHNAEVQREYQQRKKATEVPAEEEREVERTATDFYAILAEDEVARNPNRTTIDSASFCELMSEEAVAQTVHYAKVSSGVAKEWDCESAMELLVLRSKRAGGFEQSQRAEVIGVNSEGERATATIRFGPRGAVTSIPMVKEDGEWKLAASAVSPSE